MQHDQHIVEYDDQFKHLPLNVMQSLLDFQIEGIKRALECNGRVFIADEMGLGKTLQALTIAYFYRNEWPLVVICPASLLYQWKEQILKWFFPVVTEKNIFIFERGVGGRGGEGRGEGGDTSSNTTTIMKFKIIIISYASSHHLISINPAVVIVDECHYIKNCTTKRFYNVSAILASAKRIIMLSATPVSNSSLVELFTQYSVFSLTPNNHNNNNKNKNDQHHQLNNRASISLSAPRPYNFVQRFKGDTNLDISKIKKERHFLEVNLSAKTLEYLNSMRETSNPISFDVEFAKQKTLNFLTSYKDWLTAQGKVVIFYKHNEVLLQAKLFFQNTLCLSDTADFFIINGKRSPFERISIIDHFVNSKTARFLMVQIQIGSFGLDLHMLNKVLFLQLNYNPTVLLQAEDRIHRIGQKEKCLAYYVCCTEPNLPDMRSYVPNLRRKINFITKHKYIDDKQALKF